MIQRYATFYGIILKGDPKDAESGERHPLSCLLKALLSSILQAITGKGDMQEGFCVIFFITDNSEENASL